jgi:carbon-monoxide dehydrogenase large subunit
MKFGIGQSVARTEDPRLLTGGGRYVDDFIAQGQAYGHVLRSPHAAAKITKLDAAAAKKMPGVLAVLTHADAAADKLGDMPCLVPMQNRDGSERGDTPRPILANGRVRHVGDPVAFVVAESLGQARDAAETIEVEYSELPSVVDTVGAAKPGAPLVWDDIKSNVVFDWEQGDAKAVDAAFAKAAHTHKIELVNNRVVVNSMEPRGALADYDASSDRSTLYTTCQGVHVIHGQIADAILHIDKAKLRVVSGDVGGGFGMKIFLYPEPCLAVWASRKLKRAVKWTPDRSEAFQSDTQGRDNVSVAEMAMDKDLKFLALRVTTHAAMGAYLSNFGPFIPTLAGAHMITGLYRIPAAYVNVKGTMTNTVPTDAYRGAGRPEAAYLIERLVDSIARTFKTPIDEVKRRNFVSPQEMPYHTALDNDYDSGEFTAIMEKCMARADWKGFAARRAEAGKRGKLRGIGMANYIEKCGGAPDETAMVKFNDDDTVSVLIGNQTNGQGHETMYKMMLSDRLSIDVEKIRIVQGDSDLVPNGMTGGSRAGSVGGAAIVAAAEKVKEKGKQIAAGLLETAAVDIEYRDGEFRVAGTDKSVSLFAVARAAQDPAKLPKGMEPGLDQTHMHLPDAATFPNGCHIIEVEIDADTGTLTIPRYTVVDDFGDTINPMLLAGQVHGGITQGVGQALTEQAVYDPGSGQLVTGSLMDYAVPRADLVPSFDFTTHNVRCTTNPLGIKGAGEAGAIGAPPALVNAIIDALQPETGLIHIDMPATPAKIWTALHAKAKAA